MTSRPTSSDIYDVNKKTGALILGKNRLDDYATKFLTRHCKEALTTPMPLPVEKILQEVGLTVKEVSLSETWTFLVAACCLTVRLKFTIVSLVHIILPSSLLELY